MKRMRLFFLLLLLPSLLFAVDIEDFLSIHKKAIREWEKSNALIKKLNKQDPNNKSEYIHVLEDVISHCKLSIKHYEKGLKDLSKTIKDTRDDYNAFTDREYDQLFELQRVFKRDKEQCQTILAELETSLKRTISFDKALTLYNESIKKIELAKNYTYPPRTIQNEIAVYKAYQEVVKLYDEATNLLSKALSQMSTYGSNEDKANIQHLATNTKQAANKCREEAEAWQQSVIIQKNSLRDKAETLRKEIAQHKEKGLHRSAFEMQRQLAPILAILEETATVAEKPHLSEELAALKKLIEEFNDEADRIRLTDNKVTHSPEAFAIQQQERKNLFYRNLQENITLNPTPIRFERTFRVHALDGQIQTSPRNFVYFSQQNHRFLLQNLTEISNLTILVIENETCIHEEKITLPSTQAFSWDHYLVHEGMTFIPETTLGEKFGFDLRIRFTADHDSKSSILITQKAKNTLYRFLVLCNDSPVYECRYLEPPPWQLDFLCKPSIFHASRLLGKPPTTRNDLENIQATDKKQKQEPKNEQHLLLDKLVAELGNDPIALAAYVHNEISNVPFSLLFQGNHIQATPIIRNESMTFLEKQGSPLEQCQLLVYLLQKAGYQALYITDTLSSLPIGYFEKLFFTKIQERNKEALLLLPGVLLHDGSKWITLFPWMKEIEQIEGHNLYNYLPAGYESAERWIFQYLKNDETILKHIGTDADDTAGVLFIRFVEDELRKQGMSITDVGIQRNQIKEQYSSWEDFPRPQVLAALKTCQTLDKNSNLFVKAKVEIQPHEHPDNQISYYFALADLNCSTLSLESAVAVKQHTEKSSIKIKKNKKSKKSKKGNHQNTSVKPQQLIKTQFLGREQSLTLEESDQRLDIKVTLLSGSLHATSSKTLSISKGTRAALCFHFGGKTNDVTSEFYQKFFQEQQESAKLNALLSYVGSAYFHKCGRAQETLAKLHKVAISNYFAFGLAKFAPSNQPDKDDHVYPQVDMVCFDGPSSNWLTADRSAAEQFSALSIVDSSSNEHQILKEVFSDPYAISTVKLLQLAHTAHQKTGAKEEGFLALSTSTFEAADKTPELAQTVHFPHLKTIQLKDVKQALASQWDITKKTLEPSNHLSAFAYAYMTPGNIGNQNGTYREMSTLLFHPFAQYALISSNTLVINGGLGSPLSIGTLELKYLRPLGNNETYYTNAPQQKPTSLVPTENKQLPKEYKWKADTRAAYKPSWNSVADPVDVVTGAFFIDECDLSLPFGLEIRRNYNSQNPLEGILGTGWKLNLNPYLIKQDGKIFAAELDGTVIIYSLNPDNSRWEVSIDDNPELSNYKESQIGSTSNPFLAYIKNDILYSPDGSKRYFEDGLLRKWINAKGIIFTFSYSDKQVTKIESSNGQYCGFHYNTEGKIVEIYSQDGRRVHYNYNYEGELVKVTLPNTAEINYEYDRFHRIIRETKPYGKVIENVYDEQGRVVKQISPSGYNQELITTASFRYTSDSTTVEDACGATTLYKIFQNKIYKITDPIGAITLKSWFIDEYSYFDPEKEQILAWNGPGGFPKSLKNTTDKRGLTTSYTYDIKGNPIIITMTGQDLSGEGKNSIVKKLAYNDLQLCIEEIIEDHKTVTIYDDVFPFLPKIIRDYSNDSLTSYVELTYGKSGQVLKEDKSGNITHWKYNTNGLPIERIQETLTLDPDLVTTFAYNHQGQCTECHSPDNITKTKYDIVGNALEIHVFSLSGKLLASTYNGFNLNNDLVWTQSANPNNIVYMDYNTAGHVKALRQTITPHNYVAYTIYEYDARGNLIEETDPLGIVTHRDYDSIGNIIAETKDRQTIRHTYEKGGLEDSLQNADGSIIHRQYTTNGLLKKETYPDGTETSFVYDIYGRPIKETQSGLEWNIIYDDANLRVIRVQNETATKEIYQYDMSGNVLSFTDNGGYVWQKSYDGLSRIHSTTSPSGETTLWSYQGDTVSSILPNGEVATERYEAGLVVESIKHDLSGNIISKKTRLFDSIKDIETCVEGELLTTTAVNNFGLPISIQKGDVTINYEYDLTGNCTKVIDGDGNKTEQYYDNLGRLIYKKLPDGGSFSYSYDSNSNITNCQLPSGGIWHATYDEMNRKCSEELLGNGICSNKWQYIYDKGELIQAIDPMQRVHHYSYDILGRLIDEEVAGWKKHYEYDKRGLLVLGSVSDPLSELSCVTRDYDKETRLIEEKTFLNSNLLQHSQQHWSPTQRILQIGEHERTYTYQNNQLVKLKNGVVELEYSYNSNLQLQKKSSSLTNINLDYTEEGLPKVVSVNLPKTAFTEKLTWTKSGKLAGYHSSRQSKNFTYNSRGNLKTAGKELYEFDFGKLGIASRTATTNHQIHEHNVDLFGKVTSESYNKVTFKTAYNAMGEVVTCNQKQYEWDPWGELLQVQDSASTWKASYDVFGRRLQTSHIVHGYIYNSTAITNSFYDPEKEFEEIGIQQNGEIFWKYYGPNGCDAVSDQKGQKALLIHNTLHQLEVVVTDTAIHYTEDFPTSYGPQAVKEKPYDLVSYAKSLEWHSKSVDPTGLIWMGKRYYDPKLGRFLSSDPVGIPVVTNLYSYANGDPVNFMDPDGRFASEVYKPIPQTTINSSSIPSGLWQSLKDKSSNMVSNAIGSFTLDNAFEAMDKVSYAMMLIPMPQVRAIGLGLTLAAKTGKIATAAFRSPVGKIVKRNAQYLVHSGTSAYKSAKATSAAIKNTFQAGKGYVNLASESATNHIIFGEGKGSKLGGHLWPGAPGKTPFPSSWSSDKIMHLASDIATDPKVDWIVSQKPGDNFRYVAQAIREEIEIRVIIEGSRDLVTAYPVR